MKLKKTTEDYLKTIYILSRKMNVHGSNIAEELGVSRPTVSVSLKALEKAGYLSMDESRAVYLTESGKSIAKETYERHVILQQLLVELGIDKKIAAKDACEMEHILSPESFAALKRLAAERNKNQGVITGNDDK